MPDASMPRTTLFIRKLRLSLEMISSKAALESTPVQNYFLWEEINDIIVVSEIGKYFYASMSFQLLPVEIYIIIFSEVVGSQDPFFPVHANRLLHQARTQRLMCFCSIAGVCRAWLDHA